MGFGVYFRFPRDHWRGQAIAAPRNRLNQAWLRSALVEHAAQRRDLHRDVCALDDARPDAVQDLVARNEITLSIDQQAEDVEGTRTDGDRSKSAVCGFKE